MTTVNTTSGVNNASSQASLGGLNQDFDQFLRLLTTQLQNQDPLNPMDSTEFTNQLVSFSQVEQQIKTNDQLESLLAFQTLNLTAVGLSFIGKNVEITDDEFYKAADTTASMSYVMPEGAAKGTVTITDASGKTVYKADADLTQGTHKFTWDGKDTNGIAVPAGTYTLKVSAMDVQDNSLNLTTFVPGYVEGIESGDDGNLNVIVNGRLVPVTSVRKATVPTPTPTV